MKASEIGSGGNRSPLRPEACRGFGQRRCRDSTLVIVPDQSPVARDLALASAVDGLRNRIRLAKPLHLISGVVGISRQIARDHVIVGCWRATVFVPVTLSDAPLPAADWPTFAGAPTRTKVAAADLDLGPAVWDPIVLGEPLAADNANSKAYSLRRIGEAMRGSKGKPAAITNSQYVMHAVAGMGGVGKTQIALQYAGRNRHQYTAIMWVAADNVINMEQSLREIAKLLGLIQSDEEIQDPVASTLSVKNWLTDSSKSCTTYFPTLSSVYGVERRQKSVPNRQRK